MTRASLARSAYARCVIDALIPRLITRAPDIDACGLALVEKTCRHQEYRTSALSPFFMSPIQIEPLLSILGKVQGG